jgi:hypothetical protein
MLSNVINSNERVCQIHDGTPAAWLDSERSMKSVCAAVVEENPKIQLDDYRDA